MATTTNFGWDTPDDTDLVKDGAAAIRTLGQSIDTSLVDLKGGTTGQVLAKNSGTDMDFIWSNDAAGMTNPMTTTGDTIYSSSGSTPARLGIGTNGQFLSVTAGVPSWVAAPSAGANWSLLNTGGTSLSGTSTSITGISGQDKLLILVTQASTTSASNRELNIQFNSDTGSNYIQNGIRFIQGGATDLTMAAHNDTTTSVIIGQTAANAGSWVSGYLLITGCNSAGVKAFNAAGSGVAFTDTSQNGYVIGGVYTGSSTISSVQIKMQGSTFDLGTVFVYGSA